MIIQKIGKDIYGIKQILQRLTDYNLSQSNITVANAETQNSITNFLKSKKLKSISSSVKSINYI